MGMNFDARHAIKNPRLISSMELPDTEKEKCWALRNNLTSMKTYAEDFSSAVYLNIFSRQNRKQGDLFDAWHEDSFTLAIVALYNYRKAMDSMIKMRNAIPRFVKNLDNAGLEKSKESFRQRFPKTTELRQTVLHGAELIENPTKWQTHSSNKGYESNGVCSDPGGQTMIKSTQGHTLHITYAGEDVELEISIENLEFLIRNCNNIFDIFGSMQDKFDSQL